MSQNLLFIKNITLIILIFNNLDRFEMPKKSGNIQQKTTSGMIDLENKYTALSTNN
jgi:hypothetical protein